MRAGFLVAALLCGASVMPARAQMESREGIMLQNQILELRRDLRLLQQRGVPSPGPDRAPAPESGGGSGLDAVLLDRVQTLEDQVRRLRGDLDETTNALHVAQEQLAKQIEDLNFRLANGTPASATPPSRPPPPTPGTLQPPPAETPPTGPVRRTPEMALQEGNAALTRGDYAAAESAAREVLAGHNTPRAGDASFLLAQSLTGQRNFQGAAVAYDDAYKRAPTGSRAPDALLGLANALTGLSERPAACATLDKLRHEFPSIRGGVREAAATLRGRNGCP
jgi:TolA-binding protein